LPESEQLDPTHVNNIIMNNRIPEINVETVNRDSSIYNRDSSLHNRIDSLNGNSNESSVALG